MMAVFFRVRKTTGEHAMRLCGNGLTIQLALVSLISFVSFAVSLSAQETMAQRTKDKLAALRCAANAVLLRSYDLMKLVMKKTGVEPPRQVALGKAGRSPFARDRPLSRGLRLQPSLRK
jgi:hypothetical protein